jgi:hypothetical protein
MTEVFVMENRVRGGKVVAISVEESKYQSKRDVYRNCVTIEQAEWVREAIERSNIKPQQAAELVLTSFDAICSTQGTDVAIAKVKEARKEKEMFARAGRAKVKKPSQKEEILTFLDECTKPGSMIMKSELVKCAAMEFDITNANARYYIDRVWKGVIV